MPRHRTPLGLIAISDRRALVGQTLDDWIRRIAGAGVERIQLREKDLSDRELYEQAERARALCPPPTRLLINGRPDVAMAVGADGVHLPARGLPTTAVRDRFGDFLEIGRSTHSLLEVERARDEGADYVLFGPIWATPGKSRPAGLSPLKAACAVGIPVYAVGGVDIHHLGSVGAAGAVGAAAIRLFADLPGTVRAVAAAAAVLENGE